MSYILYLSERKLEINQKIGNNSIVLLNNVIEHAICYKKILLTLHPNKITPKQTMKKKLFLIISLLWMLCIQGKSASSSYDKTPLIGVSCSHPGFNSSTRRTYTESVIQAGGIPILIPITTDSLILKNIVSRLDGLILIGGEDIHPSYYQETPIEKLGKVDSIRDIYDISLIYFAANHNIPMLGICRGEQLINVAFGGSLYQDIPTQHPDTSVVHNQKEPSSVPTHTVNLLPNSKIARITGQTKLFTNTHHHQAVKQIAPGFLVTGWSNDSIPEVIENIEGYPIWGVQFHPEALSIAGDTASTKLFQAFMNKAITFQKAKEIHCRIFSIDSHTDTPLHFKDFYNIGARAKTQVSVPKMKEGYLDGQYLACWVKQGPCDEENSQKAVERIDELINNLHQQVALNPNSCAIARTSNDLIRLKAAGKKAFYIGIENGYGIGKELKNIEYFHRKGVTYITLCHSKNNDLCDSSSDKNVRWGGLSPFGRKAVKEMNRLGILIDLSHASESTFWEVLKRSKTPVIASHSSASALYAHDRNLTDDQLRALASHGGVAQACIVDEFLRPDYQHANLDDFINHLIHMINVAGIDHVGIGTDFDGGGGVKGCNGDNDLINITVRLLEHGYSEEEIAKIWGGNLLRVMNQVQHKK